MQRPRYAGCIDKPSEHRLKQLALGKQLVLTIDTLLSEPITLMLKSIDSPYKAENVPYFIFDLPVAPMIVVPMIQAC